MLRKLCGNPRIIDELCDLEIEFGLFYLLAELVVRTYFESQGRTSYPIAKRIGFPAVRALPKGE